MSHVRKSFIMSMAASYVAQCYGDIPKVLLSFKTYKSFSLQSWTFDSI